MLNNIKLMILAVVAMLTITHTAFAHEMGVANSSMDAGAFTPVSLLDTFATNDSSTTCQFDAAYKRLAMKIKAAYPPAMLADTALLETINQLSQLPTPTADNPQLVIAAEVTPAHERVWFQKKLLAEVKQSNALLQQLIKQNRILIKQQRHFLASASDLTQLTKIDGQSVMLAQPKASWYRKFNNDVEKSVTKAKEGER